MLITTTPDELNSVMQFEHIIRVMPDGMIDDDPAAPLSPPEVFDGEADTGTAEWEAMRGYSGQYGQTSADFIMHNSEFIGGRMARDILATPGLYVAVVCDWPCTCTEDDECGHDSYPEGWAVFTIADDLSGF